VTDRTRLDLLSENAEESTDLRSRCARPEGDRRRALSGAWSALRASPRSSNASFFADRPEGLHPV